MGKNILEEAVDDVQSLKKAAEESAKAMFIESMTPRIEKLIQSRLSESAEDGAAGGDAPAPAPTGDAGADVPAHPDHDAGEADVDDVDVDGDDDVDVDVDDDQDDDVDVDADDVDDEDDDNEVNEATDDDEDDEDDEDDDDVKEGKKKWPFKKVKGAGVQRNAKMKDESVELTQEDLQKAFIQVMKAGLKEDSTMGKFSDAQDPNDGEYGLAHKVPGEVVWSDGAKVIKKAKGAKMVTKESHDKVVKKLYHQLALAQEALKYYKKNLTEMNVFNAKLLYTTKLLQNNLSNKQKINVVESIDKAQTKQQVELVYRTLSEHLKIAGGLNESRKVKGPKASRFTAPGSTLTEGKDNTASEQTDRWAELAGVTE